MKLNFKEMAVSLNQALVLIIQKHLATFTLAKIKLES